MFQAGSIVSRMGLDASGFVSGMLQAQSIGRLFPQFVQDFMANPILGFVGTLKSAAQTLWSWIKDVTNAADASGELADSIGMSVETVSALGRVASMNGSNVDSLADSLRFLQRSIREAAMGSEEKSRAFADLGVSVKDASGRLRDTEEVFYDIADAMRGLNGNSIDQSALSMEVLGRQAGMLVPTLKAGSAELRNQVQEIISLGGATTREEAAKASAFQDSMAKMGMAWEGMKKAIVMPIADALTPLFNEWLDWIKSNGPEFREMMGQIGAAIAEMARLAVGALKWLMENLRLATTLAGAFAGAMAGSAFGPIGAGVGALAGAAGGLYVGDRIATAAERSKPGGGPTYNTTINVQGGGADETARRVSRELGTRLRDLEASTRTADVAGGL